MKIYVAAILIFVLFSCQNRSKKQSPKVEHEIVENIVETPKEDTDSIFAQAIMDAILEESKSGQWAVNYGDGFQQVERTDYYSDFDFTGVLKERHYLVKDKSNPFSKIEVEYYMLSNVEDAIQLIDDYKTVRNGDYEDYTHGKVIGSGHMKIPSYLFRQDSTLFYIRSMNGVAHIVHRALNKFIKENRVEENLVAW